jgi:DNA-directed RNA polymerase specialized sigma24 family protein
MANDPSDTLRLVERLRAGDRQALTDLFQLHRDRLRPMVELRMDVRLQGRVDASDVLQDAFLNAATQLDTFLRGSELSAFLWLRLVVSGASTKTCIAIAPREGRPRQRIREARCTADSRRPISARNERIMNRELSRSLRDMSCGAC